MTSPQRVSADIVSQRKRQMGNWLEILWEDVDQFQLLISLEFQFLQNGREFGTPSVSELLLAQSMIA